MDDRKGGHPGNRMPALKNPGNLCEGRGGGTVRSCGEEGEIVEAKSTLFNPPSGRER